jgi:hypothetical protein
MTRTRLQAIFNLFRVLIHRNSSFEQTSTLYRAIYNYWQKMSDKIVTQTIFYFKGGHFEADHWSVFSKIYIIQTAAQRKQIRLTNIPSFLRGNMLSASGQHMTLTAGWNAIQMIYTSTRHQRKKTLWRTSPYTVQLSAEQFVILKWAQNRDTDELKVSRLCPTVLPTPGNFFRGLHHSKMSAAAGENPLPHTLLSPKSLWARLFLSLKKW